MVDKNECFCESLDLPTGNFMGQDLHLITMSETVSVISDRVKRGIFTQHVVVNVAKLVNMRRDKKLKESVDSCDLINIDGMGVVWGARLCGHKVPERVAGVDLFLNLMAESANQAFPVFFLGARQDVVQKTVQKVQAQFPQLDMAGYHHGYFWDDEQAVVDKIQKSGAKLLFVAISSPKKENFINKWKDRLGVYFVMGVGGTFDVIAGKVNRAPFWMQQYGLEWFYRFLQEPRRMWRRYMTTNTVYAVEILKERMKTA